MSNVAAFEIRGIDHVQLALPAGGEDDARAFYAGLLGLTAVGFRSVPEGFIPAQDKDYLVAFAQLPDAATLDRTDAVIRKMTDMALADPGVDSALGFPGLSKQQRRSEPERGEDRGEEGIEEELPRQDDSKLDELVITLDDIGDQRIDRRPRGISGESLR